MHNIIIALIILIIISGCVYRTGDGKGTSITSFGPITALAISVILVTPIILLMQYWEKIINHPKLKVIKFYFNKFHKLLNSILGKGV